LHPPNLAVMFSLIQFAARNIIANFKIDQT
jgi:hypothetical protein